MSAESEGDISGDSKKRITCDSDTFEGVSPKKMKKEATSSRERRKFIKRAEFCTDIYEEEEREEYEEKPKINQKKKYLQRYSAKFENSPMFQGWVKASSKGSSYAYCIPCGTHLKITAGKTDLKKHSENKKHRANMQASQSENCITAHVLGQDQPIATVELPVPGADSPLTKKKRYYQKYSHTFEIDPLLEGWITVSAKGEYYAHCIPCDTELRIGSGKVDLRKHAKNKKHIAAMAELDQKMLSKIKQNEPSITAYMAPDEDYSISEVDLSTNTVQIRTSMGELDDNQKSPVTLEINHPFSKIHTKPKDREDSSSLTSRLYDAELQIAQFIARHDLPVDTADHLIQLIRTVCPYPSVAQNLECEGADMILIINNVLGKQGCEELMQLLRENKFSLIVDESSERGMEKHLSMAVKVLCNSSIIDVFLGLIPMKDVTVNSLHKDVVEFFKKNLIPYKNNMIGIAADGGNALLGGCHSLISLMKEDIPHLFVMKCISHSFSLCASYACLKLPRSLEDFVREVYSYFQFNTNHINLEEFEAFTSTKPHKLLHPAQTRWLSMHTVVSKILEKYDALKSYFTSAALVDKLEAPEMILQRLSIPVTKLYLMFLDFVLPIFDTLDRHMQSESTQIHVLHNAVGRALKAIFECYLNDSYVNSVSLKDIAYKDQSYFKPMEEMYLGIKVQMEVTNSTLLQDQDLKDFRVNCLEFLIESVSQIYKRFPYGCPVLESLENLNPRVVIEKNVPSLIDLICNFENLATPDIQIVDSEWRLLRNMQGSVPVNSSMEPEVFWDTVSKARQIDNVLMCPNLSEFMLKLLCLPNSTAAVEKVFSTINKIKSRSKHTPTETLMGLLYTNQVVRSKS